jgi:ABC-type glutathione transport system ATPase component
LTETLLAPSTTKLESGSLLALDDVSMVFHTRKGLFRGDVVTAVSGVSLTIARGETLALVGESGSGKTTVGRISLRLLQPTGGRVLFDGEDITQVPEDRLGWLRKRAAIVFQDPFSSLNPYMTVSDLVAEPLVIDGVSDAVARRARVRAALEAVDLTPADRFMHAYPTSMSGGQRQRVGIARALIRNPEYIVADEPVSMVDASSRVEILDLLNALQQQRGVAFLYITHDLAARRGRSSTSRFIPTPELSSPRCPSQIRRTAFAAAPQSAGRTPPVWRSIPDAPTAGQSRSQLSCSRFPVIQGTASPAIWNQPGDVDWAIPESPAALRCRI